MKLQAHNLQPAHDLHIIRIKIEETKKKKHVNIRLLKELSIFLIPLTKATVGNDDPYNLIQLSWNHNQNASKRSSLGCGYNSVISKPLENTLSHDCNRILH